METAIMGMKNRYGFIGEALTRAREVRGMSQAELARRLRVTRQSVSQYENSANAPSFDTLGRIAQELRLPLHYFLRVPPPVNTDVVFNRVASAVTKTARLAAERRFEWLKDIVSFLREFVNFPKVNFPQFDVPSNPAKLTNKMIEELAIETRRFWGLGDGVISNMVLLLENNGAIVTRYYLDAEKFDAFSVLSTTDQTPYVILGADLGIAVRSRFDASHELGHIVLHRHIEKARTTRTYDHALIERQAHRFASAFLLPASSYLNDLVVPTLDSFRAKKSKWRVSIQSQIYRCKDLGVISEEHATSLWKACNRKGWKYKEPLDDELLIEQPRLLRRAMQMLMDEMVQTRKDIFSALAYSQDDVSEITGVPLEAFEDQPSRTPIVSLKDRPQKPEETSAPPENAQIFEFRQRNN